MTDDLKTVAEALAAPFAADVVEARPGKTSGNRALAMFYIDARAVMDRLDEVLGVMGWQDEYDPLPGGCVVCSLRLRVGGEWITKMDVGAPSEQPDEGDRRKAAFSDALKRAAVKFGIGRYLYGLPAVWADFDPQKKRFTQKPQVPVLPAPRPKQAPAPPAQKQQKPPAREPDPETGAALAGWLKRQDIRFAEAGLAALGNTLAWVNGQMIQLDAKLRDMTYQQWPAAQVKVAVKLTRDRWTELKAAQKGTNSKPRLREETRRRIDDLIAECRLDGLERARLLEGAGVTAFADLSEEQAKEMIDALEEREPAPVKE